MDNRIKNPKGIQATQGEETKTPDKLCVRIVMDPNGKKKKCSTKIEDGELYFKCKDTKCKKIYCSSC